MRSLATPTFPERAPLAADDRAYLQQRLRGPQRHRLLHGYPLAAAMLTRKENSIWKEVAFRKDTGRGLLVGVLPHPFCNPAVTGCGFCTFPHEAYHSWQAAAVVEHVAQEVEQRLARQPSLYRRPVAALYFGGGTANLSPAEPFRRLCRRLAESFDLTGAEVTLEGTPAYFVKRKPLLVDVLQEEIPARHFRLSMGVQTFDEQRLRQMGRLAFGTAPTFVEVVEMAHSRGFTISGDLLFNLPGQTLEQMRQDIRKAMALDLDHLGLYHLVLFRGLGTAWAKLPEMLAGLPSNEEAANNWLQLRDLLLDGGFVQTTLTNFERSHFQGNPRRFVYEEHSFQPDRYDMLGFGPSAISLATDLRFPSGFKTLNPDASADYQAAVEGGRPPWNRFFNYGLDDLSVFYLTRRLAGLRIDRDDYRRLFRSDPLVHFGPEFEALLDEDLVRVKPTSICPTPRGMFYADSIAALLARLQIQLRRGDADWSNDNSRLHM